MATEYPVGVWRVEQLSAGYTSWHAINGKDCYITLEPRPHYCDRGNWLAKISVTGNPDKLYIDAADLWPRYYFDLERAKLEIEAWLRKRKQI